MFTSSFNRMRGLSSSVSLMAIAAAMTAIPSVVAAQEVDTITITGFRSSLEKSLELKRKSNNSIEAISAEDIAKLPDLNLAEAMQRVPGVAITRNAGEGRAISVRGLGPIFTRVMVNGLEAASTVGSTDNDGGTNRGRSFDFNVFTSDLFNNIVVQKTTDSQTDEGSLGATVDMGIAHPLDSPGLHLSLGAKEGYNDLAKKYNPRGSFFFSDTFGEKSSV